MTKNIRKAEKIVTKATTVFGDAVIQVEKANEILQKEIHEDHAAIIRFEEEKFKIDEMIKEKSSSINEKKVQISNNLDLVDQLKTFVPKQ